MNDRPNCLWGILTAVVLFGSKCLLDMIMENKDKKNDQKEEFDIDEFNKRMSNLGK